MFSLPINFAAELGKALYNFLFTILLHVYPFENKFIKY